MLWIIIIIVNDKNCKRGFNNVEWWPSCSNKIFSKNAKVIKVKSDDVAAADDDDDDDDEDDANTDDATSLHFSPFRGLPQLGDPSQSLMSFVVLQEKKKTTAPGVGKPQEWEYGGIPNMDNHGKYMEIRYKKNKQIHQQQDN